MPVRTVYLDTQNGPPSVNCAIIHTNDESIREKRKGLREKSIGQRKH